MNSNYYDFWSYYYQIKTFNPLPLPDFTSSIGKFNTSASNMQKLQLVQNFAARIISGATQELGVAPHKKASLFLRCDFCIQVHDGLCPDLPDVTVCHKKADI